MVAQSTPRTQAPDLARVPNPPAMAAVVPDGIPAHIRGLDQWTPWRWKSTGKPEKPFTKVPVNIHTGRGASSTNPATWGTFVAAYAYAEAHALPGVGFMLSDGDDLVGIDRDGCVDPKTGAVDAHVAADLAALDSYTELSVSGTGVHTLVRGVKPPEGCKKGPIEIYSRARFFVCTGRRLDGTPATVNERQAEIDALHARTFPASTQTQPAASPPTLTLDDQEIIDRLRGEHGGKAASLLSGDVSGYPSPSEARGALTMRCCFYTDDAEQIARIVASSKLFTDGTRDRERTRKATLDATTAVANYTGPRYDPEYRSGPTATITGAWNGTRPSDDTHAAAEKTVDAGQSRDELLALVASHEETIARQITVIERERERRVAAEARADALSHERSRVMRILRAENLSAGQKLTAFGVVLDLGARIANGEAATPTGHRLSTWIVGEKTGQPVATVQRHLRALHDRGILQKTTVREETEREHVDLETGEIVAAPGLRDITYITIPGGDVGKVIDAALAFRRPEDAPKHGGKRTRCPEHPTADIVRTWQDVCGECGVVLDEGQATRRPDRPECKLEPEDAVAVATSPPDLSGSSLIADPSVVIPVYRGSKLEPEPPPKRSPATFEPERFAPPRDHRPSPVGEPGLDRYTDPGWRSA